MFKPGVIAIFIAFVTGIGMGLWLIHVPKPKPLPPTLWRRELAALQRDHVELFT